MTMKERPCRKDAALSRADCAHPCESRRADALISVHALSPSPLQEILMNEDKIKRQWKRLAGKLKTQ
jgi:hypothetical protein